MIIRNIVLAVPALVLALTLASTGPAPAQETDPHHPAEGEAPAAAEPAAPMPAAPSATAMPHDMMAMCPMMATMMQGMMSAMMGQAMAPAQPQNMMAMCPMMATMMEGMMSNMMGQAMAPAQPAQQQVAAADNPAVEAYRKANEAMMKAMMPQLSGDADRDFVLQMIPHHQGAIDMARIELQYGSDPQLRKMAEDIIAAQEKEIGELNAWLAENPQ